MVHTLSGHRPAELGLANLSADCTPTGTNGSTDWLHRKGDTTCFHLSTAFHLGRDQNPQRPWPRSGAMAGDRQEGLRCQQVCQATPWRQPSYQALRWARCYGKMWEDGGER